MTHHNTLSLRDSGIVTMPKAGFEAFLTVYEVIIRFSDTGKMPCKSWSTPAEGCITGSRLRLVPGSVCSGCYARKGRYRMPNVRNLREWNAAVWQECVDGNKVHLWIDAIVKGIGPDAKHFRWFDSGDIQSLVMLRAIIQVALQLPDCQFWLPTHEIGMLKAYKGTIPSNLTIRISSAMLGERDSLGDMRSSTVAMDGQSDSYTCEASSRKGQCGDCRACWSSIPNINYPLN